jgi:hypothetical protein
MFSLFPFTGARGRWHASFAGGACMRVSNRLNVFGVR